MNDNERENIFLRCIIDDDSVDVDDARDEAGRGHIVAVFIGTQHRIQRI